METRADSFTKDDVVKGEDGSAPAQLNRVRSSSASEQFNFLTQSSKSDLKNAFSSFYDRESVSRDADITSTMYDVFFRRQKKDSGLHALAEAVKDGVRDVVHVASAATWISGRRESRAAGGADVSEKSFTSINDGGLSNDDGDHSTHPSMLMGANISDDKKTEYISVHLQNRQKHFEGQKDGPGVFVKSTRLSQTLTHHMGSIYAMEFSPDGKFLATAGEDSSLVIWSVGQKQFHPDEDDEEQGGCESRPTSSNFSSRPESSNFSLSSFGYGGTSSSGSRPTSGNYTNTTDSGSRDDDSDGARSRTNSASPLSFENESHMRRGDSFGSARSDETGEDYDDGSSGGRVASGSVTSELSGGGVSEKYRSDGNPHGHSNRLDSVGDLRSHFGWSSVPKGTRREKVIDRDVIIYPIPTRVYSKGHSEPIVDISWSKSNFLLTASSDKTVSLWHVSQCDRLQFFSHNGIVTSVDFHPVHDRFFVSGCFDGKIRFWDVISNRTLDFILTRAGGEEDTEKVTCVKFSPDGGKIVAGFFGGKVAAYYCLARGDTEYELKYQTEFYCKDRAGRFYEGRKVTGLHFIEGTKAGLETGVPLDSYRNASKTMGSMLENYLLLVSTNDSNVRLVDWAEKTTFVKYKGGLNEVLQTHATSSECQRFIITGTDDGGVVIWEMNHFDNPLCIHTFQPERPHMRNALNAKFTSAEKDKKSGLTTPVTAACFAPTSAVCHLLESAEELYTSALIQGRERFGSISSAENDKSSITSAGETSHVGDKSLHDVPIYREEDEEDLASLIMVAADFEGNVRVYVREVDSKN